MPTPTPEEIQQALQTLGASDNPQELLKQVLVGTKKLPPGWDPRAVASYYNEKCAREVQHYVDIIIMDNSKDIRISHHDSGRTIKTVNQRLIQGWMYLMDHLDPDDKYKQARDHVEIQKDYGPDGRLQGLRLTWVDKKSHPNDYMLKGEVIPKKVDRCIWREELDAWVDTEKPDASRFKKNRLDLSTGDIEYITRLVSQANDLHIIKLTDRVIDILYKKTPVNLV